MTLPQPNNVPRAWRGADAAGLGPPNGQPSQTMMFRAKSSASEAAKARDRLRDRPKNRPRNRPRKRHAARLGRRRYCARLYRLFVLGCELWRSSASAHAWQPRPAFDISVVAGDLLHVMDVLRLRRRRRAHRY